MKRYASAILSLCEYCEQVGPHPMWTTALNELTAAYIEAFQRGERLPDADVRKVRDALREYGLPLLAGHFATREERGERV